MCYDVAFSVSADEAASAEVHSGLTTGTGFVNINSASGEDDEAKRCFTGTHCNINIQSFTFDKYSEKSDWSEDALASFDGCAYAEKSCKVLKASVKFFQTDFSNEVKSMHAT